MAHCFRHSLSQVRFAYTRRPSRVLLATLLLASAVTQAWAFDCSPAPKAVRQFLQRGGWGTPDSYIAVLRDLNDDGSPEAVVFLTDPDSCGSGGCTLLVVQQQGRAWNLLSKIPIVRPPVLALERVRSGWHSLGVSVGGGGLRYHPVTLDFQHGHYRANPTLAPASPRSSSSPGELFIRSLQCERSAANPEATQPGLQKPPL